MIKADHPGAASEAIDYPACGGQASCGGVEYGVSAKQGTEAVTTAVNGLNKRYPNTKIVMIGYSEGGQIMDNNICGGPDNGASISASNVPLSASAVEQVKAVIMMGDPRFIHGLAYGVGTCDAGGFDARPEGFVCPNAGKIQSYCDSQDPYCCNGNDAAHHQQYGAAGGNTGNATDGEARSSGDTNGDAGNNGRNTGSAEGNAANAGNNGNTGGSFAGNFGQDGNFANAGNAQSNGDKC
ncbi:unnamed protein product [Fusarium graminearum]|uniref:Uncharacterized protein n=1 Tax=Gibberella zeae TaxID=5518 RepID=A0A679NNK7_GIBZA|nr:unnamed protein product [Fusarium graminearum]CAG2008548.1 unnamed protein product [Fusarium graminearum]CZS79425.1 unnamed protein product [Fusarium graminearum]